MTKPKFRLRTDTQNARHVRFTVFGNGANCGQLCMTVPEWVKFCTALKLSARRWDSPIELEFEHDGELWDVGSSAKKELAEQAAKLPLDNGEREE